MEPHLAFALSLLAVVAGLWFSPPGMSARVEPPPSPELLEAMREVDAMYPDSPPIAPSPRAIERRATEARKKAMRRDPNWLPPGGRPPPPPAPPAKVWPSSRLDLSRLIPPSAVAVEVWPSCIGAGGCGYRHRKGIPCGQALNERRSPPPPPQGPMFELVSESGRVLMRRSEAPPPPPPQPEPTRAPGSGILASR